MQYPDIEIYIKRPAAEDIHDWLDRRFGIREVKSQGETRTYTLEAQSTGPGSAALECVVVENAVKGGYTSIWFRAGAMPWPTDRDCAEEAFTHFGLEVRCSAGPWQEGDGENDDTEISQWIRFTDKGESRVNWF